MNYEKKTINKYRKDKIKVLKEFNIKLTKEQKEKLNKLNSEIAIDNFARSIILAKLDNVTSYIYEETKHYRGE